MVILAAALLASVQPISQGNELTFSISASAEAGAIEVRTEWFPGADSTAASWWLERRTIGDDGRDVYAWTTTRACPGVVPVLDRFVGIDLPTFTNASGETMVGYRTPVYRLKTTVYYPGGHLGRAIFETDTDTRLAGWIDEMLAALGDCWSSERPG